MTCLPARTVRLSSVHDRCRPGLALLAALAVFVRIVLGSGAVSGHELAFLGSGPEQNHAQVQHLAGSDHSGHFGQGVKVRRAQARPCHHHRQHYHAHQALLTGQHESADHKSANDRAAQWPDPVDDLCCTDHPRSHAEPALLRLNRDDHALSALRHYEIIRPGGFPLSAAVRPMAFRPDITGAQLTGPCESAACFTRFIRLLA